MSAGYAYYNDNDHFCCEVLRKNIACGNLPEGHVDERDIRDVRATDLTGYRHIHLFAGIGGFPLGLSRAGVSPDLRIITGGFPCQDISNAGKQAGITGARSGLWKEMYRLICELQPDYVCVENVAALLRRGIGTVLGDMAASGYDAQWQCIPASAVGAPHRRDRTFIVAYHCGKRVHGFWTKPLSQFSAFSWCQDVRSLEDLRSRSDLPPSLVWGNRNGIPAYVDRIRAIRAIGNSIAPQCAEYIGRCIVAREQQMEEDNDVA